MADIVTKLFLEDLEVLVDIGIHDFEINKPQRLQVSVSVSLDPTQIDDADEIGATFDYDFIRSEIKELVGSRMFNLQETLSRLILEKVTIEKSVVGATVTTKKIDVYPDCAGVGVQMTYTA